ncbi:hypothetical protein ACFL6S_07795 [Candidatus Poribacteria bacterium]
MPGEKEFDLSYIVGCQPVASIDKSPCMGNGVLPGKSRDVLAQVISDRVSFLKGTIDEITSLIAERQRLKADLQSNIDDDLCQIQSTIYALEQDMCGVIDKSKRRIWLEKEISELYKERRQHDLSQWQDTVKLKHEKRMAEKELRSATLDLWMIQFLS